MSDSSHAPLAGGFVLVPTPIGNLDDATPRHREALASADVVACEDTRTTGRLFDLLGIARQGGRPKFVSYHDRNESARAQELVELAKGGATVAVVSDAGMPGIADPGYRVVRAAREAGIEVTVLPGANAAITALAGSGLPTDRFVFEGFAPAKSAARQRALARSRALGATAVYYETPHRIVELLEDVLSVYGSVEVCIARELTKLHEEWLVGDVGELRSQLASRERVRGELVVVIAPAAVDDEVDADRWIEALWENGVSPQTIKGVVSSATTMKKSEVWERLERLKLQRGGDEH